MAGEIIQGFNAGLGAALRIQELRSERAAREARERAVTQQMALMMENRNLVIQERADMAKAVQAARMESSEEITVPGADGAGTFTMPNPRRLSEEQAAMKHVLPVVAKYRPEKVPDVIEGIATAKFRQSQEARLVKQEDRLSQGPTPGVASPLGKLVADYDHFRTTGNKEAAEYVRAALVKQGTSEGFQIEFDPDGKVKTIAQGARAGGANGAATTATTTKLQQSIGETEKTFVSLDDLGKTLRPGDVGIRGVFGEQVLDKLAPQFGLDTADVKRMDSRTKLKAVVQGALREVSDDTRFTEADRKAVEAILPGKGWNESYENAQQTIKTMKRIFAKRALVDSKTLGQAPPAWSVAALSKEELTDAGRGGQLDDNGLILAVRSGKLTQDEALKIRRQRKL